MRVYAPAESPSSWEEDFHLQSPLLLGGGFPPADSPPPGRRGRGWRRKNTVIT